MRRLLITAIAAIVAFLGLTPFVTAQAQLPAGLHVQGTSLVNAAGERFLISGINVESWRDKGCQWVTDGEYPARALFASTFQTMGINAVRMNYKYAWLNEAGNLDKFMDMAQEFINRGMYIMPSDHTYTGKTLVNSSAVYPMFQKIVEAFRARNNEQWLLLNPYNEPGGEDPMTWATWVAANKNVLTFMRTTVGFKGVMVLDTRTWALDYDAPSFDAVLAWDAGLLGGTANIVLSNHYYPTNGMSPVDKAFGASDIYPFLVGEAGWYNASPTDPQYVKDLITKWFTVGMPKGNSGMFAWIAAWCDTGKMFKDWTNPAVAYSDPLVITDYGKIWQTNYYSKLTGNVPPPQPTVIAATPTRTATRTVLPTNTPRTPTATPPVTSATNTPPPSATCDAVIVTTGLLNGRNAVFTTCIKYS